MKHKDIPKWVTAVKTQRGPLTPEDYYSCFALALKRMSRFLFGKPDAYQFDSVNRDARINDKEAAKDDFYSSFEYKEKGGSPIIKHVLTSAFFKYSYNGLQPRVSKRRNESDKALWKDCATNYLLKNFWHNYVHERSQRITTANYHDFGDEARYASDFEADNLANILLALSYNIVVGVDNSDQSRDRPEINNLFARNRCNRVFELRERARKGKSSPIDSVEKLVEWEWRIRRRFANQLSMRLLAGDRAVTSLSVHFFGDVKKKGKTFVRPDTRASVELNGVRFALEQLGNLSGLTDAEIKNAATSYVNRVDTHYATWLRKDPKLKQFARASLKARLDLLR